MVRKLDEIPYKGDLIEALSRGEIVA